jgi:hypothetical protein
MKINSTVRFGAILVCLLALVFGASAQKTKSKKRAGNTAATTTTGTTDEKAGAQKVSAQLNNVAAYVYKLGKFAITIEELQQDIQAGKASSNAPALNNKLKQGVVSSIQGLHTGLIALEVEFRTQPALKPYLVSIQGISDMAGTAEEQAGGGQLTEAGNTLLMVIEKLSNTLVAMP